MQLKFLFVLFVLFPSVLFAQKKKKKEAAQPNARIWNIEAKGAYDMPLADMATRFGNSFRIGAGIKYKTKANWTFGVEHTFIVGGKVKEPGLLSNLYTANGGIINDFGEVLNVGIYQRGYMTGVQVGKVLPVLNKYPNSGLTLQTGVGFMQYKINLFDRDNNIAGLKTIKNTDLDYKKGYDRLTNGVYVKQFVGYTHYSPNKLINYVIGFDAIYGFTQGRRAYFYDVQQPGDAKRSDVMVGFTFAWVIPIYKKIVEDTYY